MKPGSFRKVTALHSLLPTADTAEALGLSQWKSQTLSRSRAARKEPGDLLRKLLLRLLSWIVCPSPFSVASAYTSLLPISFGTVNPTVLPARYLSPLISNVSPHQHCTTLQQHSAVAHDPCKYSQNSL